MDSQTTDNLDSQPAVIGRVLISLAILLAVQISLRLWLVDHAATITKDGAYLMPIARQFADDPAGTIKKAVIHPGYPAAVTAMHRLTAGHWDSANRVKWETAAIAVSMAGSIIVVIGVWCFAWLIFKNLTIAFWGAMLFGLGRKFAILGADVLSDSLMLGLAVWALVLGILAYRRLRASRWSAVALAAGTGVLSAGAFLVRPEGLVVLPIAISLWIAGKFYRQLKWQQTLAVVAMAAVAMLLCIMPYLLTKGTLTKKWKANQFAGPSAADKPADTTSSVKAPIAYPIDTPAGIRVAGRYFEAQQPVLASLGCAFLVMLLLSRLGKTRAIRKFVPPISGSGVFVIVLTWIFIVPPIVTRYWGTGAMSHRYLMLPACLMAGLAPAGLIAIIRIAANLLARGKKDPVKFTKYAQKYAQVVVLSVLAVCLIVRAARPMHTKLIFARDAGLWLADRIESNQAVFSDAPLVVYYSDADGDTASPKRIRFLMRKFSRKTYESAIQMYFDRKNIVYAALLGPPEQPYASENAKIFADKGFVLIKTFPRKKRRKGKASKAIHVYQKTSSGG